MVALTPGLSSEDLTEHGSAFHLINAVSAGLSIVGSCAVIGVYLLFPQLRRFFARLVLYLAISDLWLCTSMLMGQSRAPHYMKCQIQSAFGTFFGLASIIWTLAIADSLRYVLVAQDLSVESKTEVRWHMAGWGIPALAVVLGFSTGVYGPAGLMCWIKNTALGTLVRMLTFYIPLWFTIGYCIWVYWCVTSMLKRLIAQQQLNGGEEYEISPVEHQSNLERQERSLKLLLLLPLILVFCWTPSSLRRLADIFWPGFGWTLLDYLCVMAAPMQGALNAIIYGVTPAVRDAVSGRLDHSARMLKGVQARLRSKSRKALGGRNGRRKFDKFEDEVRPSHNGTPPSVQPRPTQFGAASEGHQDVTGGSRSSTSDADLRSSAQAGDASEFASAGSLEDGTFSIE
eukprot:TRINITY_DN104079_c0_g1_i1.p1 TRINITY_DN104079_c0_g1~~TRINITY_DN104079_c0_g1_i1.p1  ORF type:complete len:400 (-),score=46.22 TRINITY_DN104079_c0_g1_i1:41-1240(-)